MLEAKRFKEIKQFTYDFEGRLVSAGGKKGDSNLKVLSMRYDVS